TRVIVLRIQSRTNEPTIRPRNNWYRVIGANFSKSTVPLSDSRVEMWVTRPNPVNKMEAHNMPEFWRIMLSTTENLSDIRIMNDNIADATSP
ncbi:MAG TPA: hypothetical protein QF397_00525, partial [Candidatus Poseidoniia archaeon]|nr:hypothetical protein [Candidatus Poseidoniia archaeon]